MVLFSNFNKLISKTGKRCDTLYTFTRVHDKTSARALSRPLGIIPFGDVKRIIALILMRCTRRELCKTFRFFVHYIIRIIVCVCVCVRIYDYTFLVSVIISYCSIDRRVVKQFCHKERWLWGETHNPCKSYSYKIRVYIYIPIAKNDNDARYNSQSSALAYGDVFILWHKRRSKHCQVLNLKK